MNYFAKNGRIIKKSVKGGHVPRRVMVWMGKRERENSASFSLVIKKTNMPFTGLKM